jgi:TPR repeat protein
MYADGDGVPKDLVIAYMWLNLAAAKGEPNAKANRDNIERQMTPDQIAEAQRLSRQWKPTR